MAKAAGLKRRFGTFTFLFVVGLMGPLWIAVYLVPEGGTDTLNLVRVDYSDLVEWGLDKHGEVVPALRKSCDLFLGRDPKEKVGPKGIGGYIKDWRAPCAAIGEIDEHDHSQAKAFFEFWFSPFLVRSQGSDAGLFTGYYEPAIEASLKRDEEFTVPIYGKPPGLFSINLGEFNSSLAGETISGQLVGGKFRPFASRGEIEAGALAGRDLELFWAKDPVAVFFLHIQGSGRVSLPDGRSIRIGYHAQNGHPYRSIGRELVLRGHLLREEVTMQSIRRWLEENPEQQSAIFNQNRSFIFFRVIKGDGPIGAQNVALTPKRSLAVDLRHMPLGVPLWIDTNAPLAGEGDVKWRRLMVAQDTGGAIRGVVRGDIFWGGDIEAAEIAGRMKHSGRYYLLLPTGVIDEDG
ncbi:MAG: MltA domain-containing protein [Pseudomonadota bacterium]|nr:MltA domain-containing protein [Pseudomonadota bacterium]